MEEVREKYTKPASGEQFITSMALFEKVPTLEECQAMRARVIALLNEDLSKGFLRYREAKPLIFFLVQSSLNVRTGPLLKVTTMQYKDMDPNKVYPTTEHKTGYRFAVAIRIDLEYRLWLDNLLEKYKLEYKKDPKLLFANTINTQCTRMSTMINAELRKRFGPQNNSICYRQFDPTI